MYEDIMIMIENFVPFFLVFWKILIVAVKIYLQIMKFGSFFIEWSYQKQTDPNVFTNWNLDKFVSLIESLIKANVQPILNDAEVLNKDNVKLRNVMKLYYFWENLGDITARFNANHDESYVPYCHFINDCLDIFNVYYPEVCSAHWPEETKPKNICKLFEDIKDGYKNRLYPYIERRKALIKGYGDGIFEYRLQCKFNQREYGSRPIESFFAQPNSGFLTGFNKLIVSSFSMLGVLMFFFLLYKLTPINRLFGSKEAERTRRWRSSVYQRTGEYTDYYGDQLDSVFGTEYGSESGTNFGSESVSNFGTETGTNFGSESVSDFGTETGTNFGSESVSDFGTERGSSYGRRQGSSYGGYYGDDNSSYMS
ncbi:VIR-like CYIR protein [Plasmodium cynomolgi strain B]|uniref:VIR-like CYIR protein n=1 Tax=Plasmodium cynomolgi (strain B) TaxID=1120755 RepID=K6URQ7_PLACD|nr:VIR-like CYIR protein [Plasmodium cynomolgi strain B]GAB64545.1 VIR-like CYIR protein [Plasmodium cynomolgi strain B]